jgi:hypothetical protein
MSMAELARVTLVLRTGATRAGELLSFVRVRGCAGWRPCLPPVAYRAPVGLSLALDGLDALHTRHAVPPLGNQRLGLNLAERAILAWRWVPCPG